MSLPPLPASSKNLPPLIKSPLPPPTKKAPPKKASPKKVSSTSSKKVPASSLPPLPASSKNLPPLIKSPLPPPAKKTFPKESPPLKKKEVLPPLKKKEEKKKEVLPSPKKKEEKVKPYPFEKEIDPWEVFDYLSWNFIEPEIYYYDVKLERYFPLEEAPEKFLEVYREGNLGKNIDLRLKLNEEVYIPVWKYSITSYFTPEKIMKFLYNFYNKPLNGGEITYSIETNREVKNIYAGKLPSYMIFSKFLGFDHLEENVYIIRNEPHTSLILFSSFPDFPDFLKNF